MAKEQNIVSEIMNQGEELMNDFDFSVRIYSAGLDNNLSEYLIQSEMNKVPA